jgi:hypothetical protein
VLSTQQMLTEQNVALLSSQSFTISFGVVHWLVGITI